MVTQEVVLKYELKIEHDLKEEQRNGRKVLMLSPKKCIEEGSPAVNK